MGRALALFACLFAASTGAVAAEHEASLGIDLEDARPLLEHLNENLDLGLDVDRLVRFTGNVEVGDEKRLELSVRFKGQSLGLSYLVHKADVNAVELYFLSDTEELAFAIQSDMIEFAESLGM